MTGLFKKQKKTIAEYRHVASNTHVMRAIYWRNMKENYQNWLGYMKQFTTGA